MEQEDEDTAYRLDNGDIVYQLEENITLFDKRSKKISNTQQKSY